ncbi:replication-associated recombination protein A [Clostridium tagluense]|uniref:replication-associated recombination protein A n=1 Tax=Clostridium tagluense TaxID=360422 RepID=UPI001CF0EE77|nr:replication-associated recombination protein A [Clostridium tagluense]MCB2300108.1 replication-associated recombination protein A [Clostridium tagluense]
MDYVQNSIFDKMLHKAPLADRVRPRTLQEYVGQEHIIGNGKILRNIIQSDNVSSMILWGPPGVGKTTLAMIIAEITCANFITFSAATSGIKEIKEVMTKAKENRQQGIRTILFIDEIHRFNKSQQDAFLPHVEKGNIVLIGATTENPSFEVNSALLSRSRVFVLNPLDINDIIKVLKNALLDKRGYAGLPIFVESSLLEIIAVFSNGDARTALNLLELAISSTPMESGTLNLTKKIIEECLSKKTLLYDKKGDQHYNIISALHKSMRNSDPNASVYWLARMLEGGEDPLYVARRLIRFASEDVGLADPNALQITVSAYEASHYIGMPECTVNLTQAVVYLAMAPKSNALYTAYESAKEDALNTIAEGVPLQLRNAPTKLMDSLGYGKDYKYAHSTDEKLTNMQCLPDNLKHRQYYKPTQEGLEKKVYEKLEYINAVKAKL